MGAGSRFFVGVLRCPAVLCGFSSCVVPSRVVVWCAVLFVVLVRGVVWLSRPLRCVELFCPPPPAAPDVVMPFAVAWSPVVARCCVLSWGAVLCCSVVPPVVRRAASASFLAGGALLPRSRWLVLCVVACCCWVYVAGSGCPLLFSARVLCCGCSCLVMWLAALLCAVVCCGAPLPRVVSRVLCCYVAVWCCAVGPCCPFCSAGRAGLFPYPVCAVPCCAVLARLRRVVFFPCRLRLCFCSCFPLWFVAVCCAVSLGVLWCGGAAPLRGVVCCGVLLCRAVFRGAVLPCGAVLLGCAVFSSLVRVVLFLLLLKILFRLCKIFNKN